MKPKGTREYVKSKEEYVLLQEYAKRVAKIAAKKLVKNKNDKNKLRWGDDFAPHFDIYYAQQNKIREYMKEMNKKKFINKKSNKQNVFHVVQEE